VELYFHSPNTSSWHGAYLSTGTTLPLPVFSVGSKQMIRDEETTVGGPNVATESKLMGL
jgi:hypothetical protein